MIKTSATEKVCRDEDIAAYSKSQYSYLKLSSKGEKKKPFRYFCIISFPTWQLALFVDISTQ